MSYQKYMGMLTCLTSDSHTILYIFIFKMKNKVLQKKKAAFICKTIKHLSHINQKQVIL